MWVKAPPGGARFTPLGERARLGGAALWAGTDAMAPLQPAGKAPSRSRRRMCGMAAPSARAQSQPANPLVGEWHMDQNVGPNENGAVATPDSSGLAGDLGCFGSGCATFPAGGRFGGYASNNSIPLVGQGVRPSQVTLLAWIRTTGNSQFAAVAGQGSEGGAAPIAAWPTAWTPAHRRRPPLQDPGDGWRRGDVTHAAHDRLERQPVASARGHVRRCAGAPVRGRPAGRRRDAERRKRDRVRQPAGRLRRERLLRWAGCWAARSAAAWTRCACTTGRSPRPRSRGSPAPPPPRRRHWCPTGRPRRRRFLLPPLSRRRLRPLHRRPRSPRRSRSPPTSRQCSMPGAARMRPHTSGDVGRQRQDGHRHQHPHPGGEHAATGRLPGEAHDRVVRRPDRLGLRRLQGHGRPSRPSRSPSRRCLRRSRCRATRPP